MDHLFKIMNNLKIMNDIKILYYFALITLINYKFCLVLVTVILSYCT